MWSGSCRQSVPARASSRAGGCGGGGGGCGGGGGGEAPVSAWGRLDKPHKNTDGKSELYPFSSSPPHWTAAARVVYTSTVLYLTAGTNLPPALQIFLPYYI